MLVTTNGWAAGQSVLSLAGAARFSMRNVSVKTMQRRRSREPEMVGYQFMVTAVYEDVPIAMVHSL